MEDEAKKILDKFYQGIATEQERELLEKWFLQHNAELTSGQSDEELEESSLRSWNFIARRTQPRMRRKLWKRVSIAAGIIMVLGAGFYFYRQISPGVEMTDGAEMARRDMTNEVVPGKQGATLTLASGKKIRLTDASNGEVAKESGVVVSKTTDGQLTYVISNEHSEEKPNNINTLSTAKGETYMVVLPDGSKVWLNAASSLTYNVSFKGTGKRVVKLNGEGYFEVAKDKDHPFIVSTDNQEVEVLGTHFNINSYSDEPAAVTTLLEGSVKVSSGNNRQMLHPGQQAINDGAGIKVAKASIESVTDWKEGELYMNHISFNVAMRKIARWYNVEVIYNTPVAENMRFGGWISRTETLASVLKSIETTGLAHFRLEGRKIYVNK